MQFNQTNNNEGDVNNAIGEPPWIRCADRLPVKSGRYMAYVPAIKFVTICHYVSDLAEWDMANKVTYWMPLPLSPKEEQHV